MAEWVCANCRSINNPNATACYSCASPRHMVEATPEQLAAPPASQGSARAEASGAGGAGSPLTPTLDGLGAAPALGGPPAGAAPAVPQADGTPLPSDYTYTPAVPQRPTNVLGGLLAGFAAALVATIVWYGVVVITEYQIGFVAAGIGWLVGFAVVFGAGGRASMPLVVASAVFTILALAISQYLIEFHFFAQAFGIELELADLIQPIDFVIEVIVESLRNDPLTLVFWAIGLFGAVSVPFGSMSAQEG